MKSFLLVETWAAVKNQRCNFQEVWVKDMIYSSTKREFYLVKCYELLVPIQKTSLPNPENIKWIMKIKNGG